LGPRNIYKIFAGGNHSWVVLDDIIPVREKYRAPSPLPQDAPSVSRSPSAAREKSRGGSETRTHSLNRQSVSGISGGRQSTATPKTTTDFSIDITYSLDSQMIHRYINFEIGAANHEKVFVALQKYVQLVEQDDQGAFMYHQI
jgi:hypothetical protein